MIRRPRYRGVLEWGHVGAAYRGGTRVTFTRKRVEVVRVERPELRIIPAELAERVDARLAQVKARNGGMGAPSGREPRYLLSGKAVSRCATCGGPMHVAQGKQGKRIIKTYACLWHRDRGPAVCDNNVRRPMEAIDAVVLGWIRESILTEEFIARALVEVRRRLAAKSKDAGTEIATVQAQVERLDREIKRLVAVASSVDEADQPAELAEKIESSTKRRRELRARLDVLRAAPGQVALEIRNIEQEARAPWRARGAAGEQPGRGPPLHRARARGPRDLHAPPLGRRRHPLRTIGEGRDRSGVS
jgi:site-specific DNA recombinase